MSATSSMSADAFSGPNSDYLRSTHKWQTLVRLALSMPPGHFPDNVFNLEDVLLRIPKLPPRLPPETVIQGYSTWSNLQANGGCELREKKGKLQDIYLRNKSPMRCTVSSSDSFKIWEGTPNNGLLLLVLAWAYIFSARLAEKQGLSLEHQTASSLGDRDQRAASGPSGNAHVDLSYASSAEFAWWKLITTSGTFFSIQGSKECLPWTVVPEFSNFTLAMSYEDDGQESAQTHRLPTACEAAIYLNRLCEAYSLARQSSAALSAAVSLPSHRGHISDRNPIHLPAPSFSTMPVHVRSDLGGPSGFDVLDYLMVLSLKPNVYIPCLQSILWEPNVACNEAGALLRAAHNAIEPILRAKNYELFVKVISYHKSAPLWLGTAICGRDPGMLITTIYGDWFGQHDDAAAWTGIPHSFMDICPPGPYLQDDRIARAQVWRLRHDCHSKYARGDDYSHRPRNGWEPYGSMQLQDVELELHEHLHCSHDWRYSHWTWLPGEERDTGFKQKDLPNPSLVSFHTTHDHRSTSISPADAEAIRNLSQKETQQTFWWCSEQVERGFTEVVGPRMLYDPRPPRESGERAIGMSRKKIRKWLRTVPKNETSPYAEPL
ncbi:hypothetical protein F4778DRAFT_743115 [Xylariomycetidae sp. FL2044]|nr:hypothetical protein F4778DRAFT_743115 [Xylariomycetidae sp. FL2044]